MPIFIGKDRNKMICAVMCMLLCMSEVTSNLPQPSIGPKYRIAFVFAGSSRSLILPSVYLTIKKNLIEAGCPYPLCIGDVFARVSTTDNILAGMNSSGITVRSSVKSVRDEITRAISLLSERGSYVLEWSDIGSEEEEKYLSRFTSLRHKIFRTMDRRRYSMYGNRAAAFELALKHEERMNIQYTYVVHVRLDCTWFEPVPPLHTWYDPPQESSDTNSEPFKGIWVKDRWFYPPPDTFAVMPRALAEDYFSLDNLVYPGVMCLGGPNFDPRLLNPQDLASRGFTEDEYEAVKGAACHADPLIKYINSFVNGKGIEVHFTGFSEAIYGRKLNHIGISHAAGTLKFRALPMAIVRYDGTRTGTFLQCTFLYKDFTFDFLRKSQSFPTSLLPACHMLEYQQRRHAAACMRKATGRYVPPSHFDVSIPMGKNGRGDVTDSSIRSVGEWHMTPEEELACERGEFRGFHQSTPAINTMPFNIHIGRKNLVDKDGKRSAMDPSLCLGVVEKRSVTIQQCVR